MNVGQRLRGKMQETKRTIPQETATRTMAKTGESMEYEKHAGDADATRGTR